VEIVSILSEGDMVRRDQSRDHVVRPQPPYRLRFPSSLVEEAARRLADHGERRLEQLVLWGGYPTTAGVAITTLLLPTTEATWGWVHVLPPEQPWIAHWLFQHRQLLFVEAHTHGEGPRATEMSDEDRRHPAGRQDGFLTIIVPGYARGGIDFARAGVWECRDLRWARLSSHEIASRLCIIDDEEVRRALR